MADDRIYDGQTVVIAQDADADPSYLGAEIANQSVNRQFRGGKNRTRPMIREIELIVNDNDKEIIQKGNFQGGMFYNSVRPGTVPGLLACYAGHIFYFEVIGNYAIATRLNSDFSPSYLHTWFCQAEDRVYIQNANNFPLSWDGFQYNQATFLNPFDLEMPVGTFMAYAHGRVHLALENNLVVSSDNIFSNGFTDTSATKNFSEIQYWANGGAFGAPLQMGEATGMITLPALGGQRAQGELIVFYREGAMSINAAITPRTLWSTEQINRVALTGRGCRSPWSICTVNGDAFYRADDGWAFFGIGQSEFVRSFNYRKLSREVNEWVSKDDPFLVQFASSIYFDNRILCTVSPYLATNEVDGWGDHRAHRGMVVVDLDQSSGNSPDAGVTFRWNGIWSGIRPTQLVKGVMPEGERAFAFSFDDDGVNRIYEITKDSGSDFTVANGCKPIKSYYTTKRFDFENKFGRKELFGGDIWVSENKSDIELKVEYRPDNYPCWLTLLPTSILSCSAQPFGFGSCPLDFLGQVQFYKKVTFGSPEDVCISNGRSTIGNEFQLKVSLEGEAKVDRLRISASKELVPDVVSLNCETQDSCDSVKCCVDNPYDYHIINPKNG